MVDAIGVNKVAAASEVARVSTVAAVRTPQPAVDRTAQNVASSMAITLSKQMASAPPVDMARVTQIRKAIANGTFPILPATIADQMLALKMNWTSHDAA